MSVIGSDVSDATGRAGGAAIARGGSPNEGPRYAED